MKKEGGCPLSEWMLSCKRISDLLTVLPKTDPAKFYKEETANDQLKAYYNYSW